MTDGVVNHLMVDSTNGLVCLNARHFDCSLAEVPPRLIHYFLPSPPHPLQPLSRAIPRKPYSRLPPRPGVCTPNPTDFVPSRINHRFRFEGCRPFQGRGILHVQRRGDSLRTSDILMSLTEMAVNHILRLGSLRVWPRMHKPTPNRLTVSHNFPASSGSYHQHKGSI